MSPTGRQRAPRGQLAEGEIAGRPPPSSFKLENRLASLRRLLDADLGFHGAPGQYATHGWHPFPAKFPPQLPRVFIEALSAPGETVLDPMAGSGTTLVEAQRLGRDAIGCDIDPLARLIVTTKLTPVDVSDAAAVGRMVLQQAQRDFVARDDALRSDLDRRFDAKTRAFVNYWFRPGQQLELLALMKGIEALSDDRVRRFLKVVFSSTIIAKSGGVSLARDLAHTRPHRAPDKEPKSAFAEFEKRLMKNLSGEQKRHLYAVGEPPARVAGAAFEVRDASAERTGLPPGGTDLVVTSPPYANGAIDYMRAHKFSLVWFGWKVDDLTNLRKRYLGHDAMSTGKTHELPEVCEGTLNALTQRDRRKAAVLRRYFSDMTAVIAEMNRVLRPGRAAIMVVGTSVLRGLDVRTHEGLAAIGEMEGLFLAGIGVRRLDRDKRMMPARWSNRNRSQIEERMHEEYVIGWVKR